MTHDGSDPKNSNFAAAKQWQKERVARQRRHAALMKRMEKELNKLLSVIDELPSALRTHFVQIIESHLRSRGLH